MDIHSFKFVPCLFELKEYISYLKTGFNKIITGYWHTKYIYKSTGRL